MTNKIANDLIRYAELVEDGALISPEEMNCASVMRLAAEYLAQPAVAEQHKHEPVAWRNAAIRVGEDLCSVGPFGYYDMNAEQWLDWALSVVTVHAPPPQRTAAVGEDTRRAWVGLSDDEINDLVHSHDDFDGLWDFADAVAAKLHEKNT